jgi:polysaccharide chain length determinant protein (PEP-CTERM system associated)
MLDQFTEILYFAKGIVRNKWIVTLVAWLICIGGWMYVYKMPDIYESSARVHVNTRTMLRPLLRGLAIQSDVRGLVAIMKKLMFTQENMLKIAEIAGMDVDRSSEKSIHNITETLKDNLKIQSGRGEIFSITFESKEPQNAKNVVQAVLSVFSEQAQNSTLGDADSAQRFIDNQIRKYEQRLRNAERAKENFKRDNLGLLPGQAGEGHISVIQAVRQKIEDSNMQLSEMLSRRKVLQTQLSEAMKSGKAWGLIEGGQDKSTDGNLIFQMMERKNELLLKYTENHPIIVSMESEIKLLKKRQDEEEKLSGSSAALAMSSPYVQSIKIQKNEIDTEIATINSRIAAYEKKLKHENDQFNSRLTIETEMANLNRGYETIKKNYLELIDRREQARMSGNVDSEVSALKFKIVDPANTPDKPSSPNRMILYSVVLVFGVLAGLALALSMVFIRPSFVEAKHLRDVTGLPILGTVSEVVSETKAKENRSRLVKFILANVMLFFGYIGVMALEALS